MAAYKMVRLTQAEAEHLMMAPAVAGGWVAVQPDVRESVEAVLARRRGWDNYADLLALLPATWEYGDKRPVSAAEAADIASDLDGRADADLSVVFDEPADLRRWARRIREACAVAERVEGSVAR